MFSFFAPISSWRGQGASVLHRVHRCSMFCSFHFRMPLDPIRQPFIPSSYLPYFMLHAHVKTSSIQARQYAMNLWRRFRLSRYVHEEQSWWNTHRARFVTKPERGQLKPGGWRTQRGLHPTPSIRALEPRQALRQDSIRLSFYMQLHTLYKNRSDLLSIHWIKKQGLRCIQTTQKGRALTTGLGSSRIFILGTFRVAAVKKAQLKL